MVSGLVTSPWDHERIFSGLARLMRMESKSAIKLARSYGLLRYKVVSSSRRLAAAGCGPMGSTGPAEKPTAQELRIMQSCRVGAQHAAPLRLDFYLVGGFFRRFLPLHQFDVEAERLQLAHQHVERLRHARLDARLALDDGLVNFRAAVDVVGLRREQLLQDVRGSVRFQRPNFHFAEALPAELRLAAQRLLGDQRVRADRTRVNLVVDEMRQLEHVDVADGDRLVELLPGHAVEQ